MQLFWFYICFANAELCLEEINVSQEQPLKRDKSYWMNFCYLHLQGSLLHGKAESGEGVSQGFILNRVF